MPSTLRSIRAYEMRPEGVRARVEGSPDSMKHHSLTEVEGGKRGRAHRRSRIPRFSVLSNALQRARAFWPDGAFPGPSSAPTVPPTRGGGRRRARTVASVGDRWKGPTHLGANG